MSRPRILMMGRRRRALLAAERMGVDVLLVHDDGREGRIKRTEANELARFDDREACVRAAERLAKDRPVDAVVAVVERTVGAAATVREALGVPGPRVEEANPWRDKVAMKEAVAQAGVPCAEMRLVMHDTDPEALVAALGLPLVIKPRTSSGSRGTLIAKDLDAVRAARMDGRMAERFVRGTELSVESFVQGGEVVFENITSYLVPAWANIVPSALSPRVAEAVRALNRAAIAALAVRDSMVHLEAYVTQDDGVPQVVFGELAARPPGGYLMDLIELAYGFDPWEPVIDIALGRPVRVPTETSAYAGVWLLHPGAGVVETVLGLEDARSVDGVLTVECKLSPGQRVSVRRGTGELFGRVLVRTGSYDETEAALRAARAKLRFVMRGAQ